MNKVLVTGGAGFIGSHLVELLLSVGAEVYVLDNLSTGSAKNLEHLSSNPKLHTVFESVTNRKIVNDLVSKIDVVYHLAASVGVKLIVNDLVGSIENNVKGTEVVLAAASQYGKKVLLTSTSEVYGRSNVKPYTEEDDLRMGPTLKTRWSYACSKALDEYLGFAYYHEKGLPVTVVRLFNTVGERQSDAYGMVLPTFVKQAVAGKPLTIYGDGKQSRCFCHVSDVVGAIYKLMEHSATSGQIYNIGNDEELTIEELADKVIKTLASESAKQYISYKEAYKVGFDDIERRVPNIEKVKRLIGFKSQMTIDNIILRIAESIKTRQTVGEVKVNS